MKNRKYLRYPGCQCHLKYEAPAPPYSMWFYGLQRLWNQPLKFVLPAYGMNFRIHQLTTSSSPAHLWLFQALDLFSYSCDGVYSTFLQVLITTSCSFIFSFVTPKQVTKSFLPPFYTSKSPSSPSLNMLHCRFSASEYLHSSTYTWGW